MRILVYGNPLLSGDNAAHRLVPFLEKRFPQVKFSEADPLEEMDEEFPIILDVCLGINETMIITSIDQLKLHHATNMHDFDLGLQLALLLKLGKIKGFKIICVPQKPNKKDVSKALKKLADITNRTNSLKKF